MLENRSLFVLISLFAVSYVVRKLLDFRRAIHAIHSWPGYRTVLSAWFLYFPFSVRGVSPGPQWSARTKYRNFAVAGWDVLAAVNVFPRPFATFYLADPFVIKEVVGARARFPKPVKYYEILEIFGPNIVVTEGDLWKRQRRIAAPAFSEKNHRLVWDETVRILEDVFQNVWGDADETQVPHIMDLTVPVTLLVIGIAGFGRRMSWDEEEIVPLGHSMTFKASSRAIQEALREVNHNLILKVILPDWVLRWGPSNFRYFAQAYEELERYFVEMVHARRTAEGKEERRHDLFSDFLDANEEEHDSGAKLSDEELIGNVFLFLLAGHETTAHTLAYAFILLALYPDEQEAFYQSIKSVLPPDRSPTYDEFSSLSYAMAVLNETLRWFPPVAHIPKESAEDTAFNVTSASGEKATIPVPRGSLIDICVPALHHNSRYWDEPEAFKPARFLGDYPRDAFMPFSGGPRGCLGRGFAETESVAVLTLVVSKYRVEVKDEPQFRGETFEQRKLRLLKSKQSLTVYPERAPLVFKRR